MPICTGYYGNYTIIASHPPWFSILGTVVKYRPRYIATPYGIFLDQRLIMVIVISALCEVLIRIISHHLVFDIGGISIKRSAGMVTMNGDMGGAACMVATVMS